MENRLWATVRIVISAWLICLLLAVFPEVHIRAAVQPIFVSLEELEEGETEWQTFRMSNDAASEAGCRAFDFIMPADGYAEVHIQCSPVEKWTEEIEETEETEETETKCPNISMSAVAKEEGKRIEDSACDKEEDVLEENKEHIFYAGAFVKDSDIKLSLEGCETEEDKVAEYDISICVMIYPDESWTAGENCAPQKVLPMGLSEDKTGNLYSYGDTDCFEFTAGSTNFCGIKLVKTENGTESVPASDPKIIIKKDKSSSIYCNLYEGNCNENLVMYLQPGAKYKVKIIGKNCDYKVAIQKVSIGESFLYGDTPTYYSANYELGKGYLEPKLACDRSWRGSGSALLKYPYSEEYPQAKYTGKEIIPQVAGFLYHEGYHSPYLKTISLTQEDITRNFILAYESNINPGTGYVTLTGKGYLEGKMKIPFRISQPAEGFTVKNDKAIYRVLQNKSVAFVAPASKSVTKIALPSTIKIAGLSYKVTEIASAVCKGRTKLKSLVIGSNVRKIGSKAFYGCTNLKVVTVKTKNLKKANVGKSAFKKLHAKAKIKVPASKLKSYKNLLKNRGLHGEKQKVVK